VPFAEGTAGDFGPKGEQSNMANLTIHIAVIEHRHGFNHYAGGTEQELDEKLAAFCREWWTETDRDGEPPEDDSECIAAYFEDHETEWLTTGTDIIAVPELVAEVK
jgi:hypothetical protein